MVKYPNCDSFLLLKLNLLMIITFRSLVNRKRRMPELRRAHSRLRSLDRSRYVKKVCSKKFGDDFVINKFIGHVIDFIECSFSEYTETNASLANAVVAVIVSLRRIAEELERVSCTGKGLSPSHVRQFGKATSNLYQQTRKLDLNSDCTTCWEKLGLCAQIIFE
jgi:hypothetical protein